MDASVMKLLLGAQGVTSANLGAGAQANQDMRDKMANNKWDEVGLMEAVAAKEVGKVGAGYDLNQLRPPVLQGGSV